jgi:YD repeat-containing protein
MKSVSIRRRRSPSLWAWVGMAVAAMCFVSACRGGDATPVQPHAPPPSTQAPAPAPPPAPVAVAPTPPPAPVVPTPAPPPPTRRGICGFRSVSRSSPRLNGADLVTTDSAGRLAQGRSENLVTWDQLRRVGLGPDSDAYDELRRAPMNERWTYAEGRLAGWNLDANEDHQSWEFTYDTAGHLTGMRHNGNQLRFEVYRSGPSRGLLRSYRESDARSGVTANHRFDYDATEAEGAGELFVLPGTGELLVRGARHYFSLSAPTRVPEQLSTTFPVSGDGSPERLPTGDLYNRYEWLRDCSNDAVTAQPR